MQEKMIVYRNPGLQLTHFQIEGNEDRTACKHYPISKMDRIEHDPMWAAIWCTDCMAAVIRKEQNEHVD